MTMLVIILLIYIVASFVLKSPWFKGRLGETTVNLSFKIQLDKNKYHILNNVTLPTEDGTTQIDHIVVSRYGIFVIETKNMKGWIFGSPEQRTWTQKIYKHSSKFQNPLHQNYKHVQTLQSILGLDSTQVYSAIIFIGDSTFKTAMPENVANSSGKLVQFIKSKTLEVFTESEVSEIISKIETGRLTPSFKTEREHIKHVKEIVSENKSANLCPRCGSPMVLREMKKRENAGKQFWGCSKFPKCRGIVNISCPPPFRFCECFVTWQSRRRRKGMGVGNNSRDKSEDYHIAIPQKAFGLRRSSQRQKASVCTSYSFIDTYFFNEKKRQRQG